MTLGYEPPSYSGRERPPVIVWFRVYAATMALVQLVAVAMVVLRMWQRTNADVYVRDRDADVVLLVLLLVFLFFLGFFVVATFVPYKPWGWSVGLVAIGLGCSGIVGMIICVPMLLYWLKPITKAAFGRLPI